MNERICQAIAEGEMNGMSEMELHRLRDVLERQDREEEMQRTMRQIEPTVRAMQAAERVRRVCGGHMNTYPVRAAPAPVAPPAAPTPAPSASAPAVAVPEPVAAINSLPKSQWKLPRSNRWTTAAKNKMRAMRATCSDAQIAEAFGLGHARQVGNLIGSRAANKSQATTEAHQDHRKIIEGCIESSIVIGSASRNRIT